MRSIRTLNWDLNSLPSNTSNISSHIKEALGYSSIEYAKSEHLRHTSSGHPFLRSTAYHLPPNKVNKDMAEVVAIWLGILPFRMRDSHHFFIDATFDYIPHPNSNVRGPFHKKGGPSSLDSNELQIRNGISDSFH